MTTTSSTSTVLNTDETSPLERLLAAIAAGEGVPADVFTPKAELDAVVPGWRFGLIGAETIAAQFTSWFADPGAIEELRRLPFAGGEVVECTVTWTEQGIPHAARQVHVLDLNCLKSQAEPYETTDQYLFRRNF